MRRKNTDPPWLDKKTAKLIEDRKKLYVTEGGRTDLWKQEKKKTNEAVKKRKRAFFDRQKDNLLAEDANRNFYEHVRNFAKAERPKLFDMREMLPDGQSDKQSAEDLASYFNRISNEFDPLGWGDVPCTRDKELQELHEWKN